MAARIQDLFTITDPDSGLQFTDAIYYEVGNEPADLEAQKQARFDAWKEAINNPPPFDPTPEEPDVYEAAVVAILEVLDDTGTALADAESMQEAKDAGAAQVEAVAVIAEDLGVVV
jgi:hypothetical protein